MTNRLDTRLALTSLADASEEIEAMRSGLLLAVAYGDVFDYAMRVEEIQRYLVGVRAGIRAVKQLLWEEAKQAKRLSQQDGLVCLAGREALFEIRRERQAMAEKHWQAARAYGRILAGLPFARMVAVTGSLAVDNLEADGDIDYLVVTAPGRVWLCRAMAILVVRWAAQRGHRLCPNYFISQDKLASEPEDLYNAHELAQMVPLNNLELYKRMRASNPWTQRYLPNAQSAPRHTLAKDTKRWEGQAQRLAEAGLSGRLGGGLENWEMKRKIARFERQQAARDLETNFCTEQCKGHFEGHAGWTMAEFAKRVKRLRIPADTSSQPAHLEVHRGYDD
jgi:hypothetical protein